jgi:hypothetical protein
MARIKEKDAAREKGKPRHAHIKIIDRIKRQGTEIYGLYGTKRNSVEQINKFCMLPASACISLYLYFELENRGDMFLRNIGWPSVYYMALCPSRQNSLCSI